METLEAAGEPARGVVAPPEGRGEFVIDRFHVGESEAGTYAPF